MTRQCKSLTIFEGPDGSGKSTLARQFADVTGAIYVHFAQMPDVTTGLARMYVEAMMPALMGHKPVVFDRCWLSEGPYGQVFRGGQDRLGVASNRMLERLAMRCGAVVVQCQPTLATCLGNFNSRRQDEMLQAEEQLQKVYTKYLQVSTALPRLWYNYVSERGSMMDLIDRVDIERFTHHGTKTRTAGALHAPVLLVGEAFSMPKNDDPFYQWPFASFKHSGCSQWLAEQLEQAHISEAQLLWINADQLDGFIVPATVRQIYALGAKACQVLTAVGLNKHHTYPHPQYMKRFHSNEPYGLMTALQGVLNVVH